MKKIKLFLKAFECDYRGLSWEEDRYIVLKNGFDYYGEHFDLETANNLVNLRR